MSEEREEGNTPGQSEERTALHALAPLAHIETVPAGLMSLNLMELFELLAHFEPIQVTKVTKNIITIRLSEFFNDLQPSRNTIARAGHSRSRSFQ